jgi:beta-aspartyl-peptidase (threonine type)
MSMAIIVHGGAGAIPGDQALAHQRGCEYAAQLGWEVLTRGGRALDAVQAAIVSMEDDSVFDAGRGSVLNRDGEVEMDAALMDGRDLNAGAVAGVQRVKNPIVLARAVLNSEHVFIIGAGAEQFAASRGLPLVDPRELITKEQMERWRAFQKNPPPSPKAEFGTVGCVAVDQRGDVAAGTSTGGMDYKIPGRVGDSPIIGAGVYADNLLGGASTTGWGEAMIRVVLAKTGVDFLADDRDVTDAARAAIDLAYRRVGGFGGIVLANRRGRVGFAFNTPRMAVAYVEAGNKIVSRV